MAQLRTAVADRGSSTSIVPSRHHGSRRRCRDARGRSARLGAEADRCWRNPDHNPPTALRPLGRGRLRELGHDSGWHQRPLRLLTGAPVVSPRVAAVGFEERCERAGPSIVLGAGADRRPRSGWPGPSRQARPRWLRPASAVGSIRWSGRAGAGAGRPADRRGPAIPSVLHGFRRLTPSSWRDRQPRDCHDENARNVEPRLDIPGIPRLRRE
jgi:hypothetical protein